MLSDEEKIREVIAELDRTHKEIEAFAKKIDQTYDSLMAAADKWLATGEETDDGWNSTSASWYNGDWGEFWDLYEKVRGVKDVNNYGDFFTCTC
jgi:hypothetical protein